MQEISVVDKLKYLHSILAYVLPVLKQIYSNQCFEIGVETPYFPSYPPLCNNSACFKQHHNILYAIGPKMDIIRAKMNSDEQMCWYCFCILLSVAFIIGILLFLQYNLKL